MKSGDKRGLGRGRGRYRGEPKTHRSEVNTEIQDVVCDQLVVPLEEGALPIAEIWARFRGLQHPDYRPLRATEVTNLNLSVWST